MGKNRRAERKPVISAEPSATNSEDELRERLFKESYDELVKKQISNSENFDRSVLTLSASGLGLSLAFLKDITPLANAMAQELLVVSWALFGVSIVATIASFMTSQAAIRFQIHAAQKYYLDRENEYLAKTSVASRCTDSLNFAAGIAFIAAILCTILFVTINLPSSTL